MGGLFLQLASHDELPVEMVIHQGDVISTTIFSDLTSNLKFPLGVFDAKKECYLQPLICTCMPQVHVDVYV